MKQQVTIQKKSSWTATSIGVKTCFGSHESFARNTFRQSTVFASKAARCGATGIELNSIRDVPPETPGWFALGLTPLAFDAEARRGAYSWLNSYQYTMVGKSIRLYHVPGSSP
jgi:hypothetical protein